MDDDRLLLSVAQCRTLRAVLANAEDGTSTYPGEDGVWASTLKALERRGFVECAYTTRHAKGKTFRVVRSAWMLPAGFEAARALPPEVGGPDGR
jgi:hypothetical protein